MRMFRPWFSNKQIQRTLRPSSFRPGMECLESREVPTVTSISSNFNGTAIPANSSVWFSSVGKVSGLGTAPATIHLTNATITSGNFTVSVPDAVITITSAVTTATTTYDAPSNTWITTLPRSGFSGNVFLSGATLPAPDGLPGGMNPVVWQADFTTDTPGVNINWKWAAAVYTQFSPDYSAVGVKPIDGSVANPYANSHHAGTPENFTAFVDGGARGGGGSNFTGSYSATKSVKPGPIEPPPAFSSLSGFVFLDDDQNGIMDPGEGGIAGVQITLQGTNDLGQTVFTTVLTDNNGFYQFANLRSGTYSLTETQPANYWNGQDSLGTQGGTLDDDLIFDILLGANVDGLFNNFGEEIRAN